MVPNIKLPKKLNCTPLGICSKGLKSLIGPRLPRKPPQLQSQSFQQPLKPRRLPAGFHANKYRLTHRGQGTKELFLLPGDVLPLFFVLSGVGIYRSNFLIRGVKIGSCTNHRSAPFLRARWLVLAHQLYSDLRADIVMESIALRRKSLPRPGHLEVC